MFNYKKITWLKTAFLFILLTNTSYSDNHNLSEIIDLIQKDLKTLEKAVYSDSINSENLNNQKTQGGNSEKVLTRHLLKLSEIENQFQELTNKFEEINFKLDKLSNRLSKVQADNQIRFQDIENVISSTGEDQKENFKKNKKTKKDLPGSSQPQDLGSISYEDNTSNEASQKIQSVDVTGTVITEEFEGTTKNTSKRNT